MRPGIRAGTVPPFHELDEYVFQEMCRDVLYREPSIATCGVYGKRGQRQLGIDLLAHRQGGDGLEVGQCKRYATFSQTQLREASDEFLAHWDYWSEKKISRFVLFVACSLDDQRLRDEITTQQERFAQYDITYEAWDAADIRNKLRPYRDIVATYCKPPEYWTREICGEGLTTTPFGSAAWQTSIVVDAALANYVGQLSTALSSQVERDLEDMREAWREGRHDEAVKWVGELKDDTTRWAALTPQLKARVLVFEAIQTLDTNHDIQRARRLVAEAQVLAPTENYARIGAFIAYRAGDVEGALQLLDGQEDIDSINFRAVLLLHLGRIEECRAFLEPQMAQTAPSAETYRIRALLHLVAKDISGANLEIEKALELQPRWLVVRFSATVIDYMSALSPAALPEGFVLWPEPVDWTLVKRDDQSLQHLRDASVTFADLIETSDYERQMLQSWLLGCLANDPERQADAVAYCQAILKEDPTDYRALAWAVARNFAFDVELSIQALHQLVEAQQADLPHVVALLNCLIIVGRKGETLGLLETTQPLFEQNEMPAVWASLYARSLALVGEPQRGLTIIDTFTTREGLLDARTLVLHKLAEETGDWQPLFQHLENSYDETGDSKFLLYCCELKVYQKDWVYVSDRAAGLVERIGTSDAASLAAMAAYYAGRFDQCLRLLDEHLDLYRERRLPNDLRRLRVECKVRLGILPAALADAEELAREERTTTDWLNLAQVHLEVGNLKEFALIARRVSKQPDLTVEQALWLASNLYPEERLLAISLWRRATSDGLSDELIVPAVDLGFRLGLDNELHELMPRLMELAQRGQHGLQLFSITDVPVILGQQRKSQQEILDGYRDAKAPIHIVAQLMNWNLADLYHRVLAENEAVPHPARQFALLARHGGRTLPDGLPQGSPSCRLNVDITAILLAHHLDVLSAVEEVFQKLRLPAELVPALRQMRSKLAPHQPSRLEDYRQIVDLTERGALHVEDSQLQADYKNTGLVVEVGKDWAALFERARSTGGYMVDYLPVRAYHKDPSVLAKTLPEDASQCMINCRSIVEALRQYGPLAENQYALALEALGEEGRSNASRLVPRPSSSLYCYGNTPEVLAEAGLLQMTCERFKVHVQKDELDRARAALVHSEKTRETIRWVSDLIDQISQGISGGIYEVIPPLTNTELEREDIERTELELRSLFTLLQLRPRPGDVIWVDDRCVNRYLHQSGIPIVGINEILKHLVTADALSPGEYYDRIGRLRGANIRFLPLDKDEVLYHLQRARVEDGKLVETRDLAILRSYIAACLLQASTLQRPPEGERVPTEQGEFAFLTNLAHVYYTALQEIWDASEDEATCRAYADWVIANLYVNPISIRRLIGMPSSIENEFQSEAIHLAFLASYVLSPSSGTIEELLVARRRYCTWLSDRFLTTRFITEPRLLLAVVGLLRGIILSMYESAAETPARVSLRTWLQLAYLELPEMIRDELERDAEFAARFDVPIREVTMIAGLAFEWDAFWSAAAAAVNGHPAVLTPIDSDVSATLRPLDTTGTQGNFYLDHPAFGTTMIGPSDELTLLLDSASEREVTLRRNPQWFDCGRDELDRIISEIASIKDPRMRIETAADWRSSSAAEYYDNLYGKLGRRRPLKFSELMLPSGERWVQHMRLPVESEEDIPFQTIVAKAAETLLEEEGLVTALHRLAGLPVPLPRALLTAIGQLSTPQRRRLLKALLETYGSPVSRFHLMNILQSHPDLSPAYSRLVDRIAKSMLTQKGMVDIDAFLAILRWLNNELEFHPEVQMWPPHLRLAMVWSHAHRLFVAYADTGALIASVRAVFSTVRQPISEELFERTRGDRFDVAHPWQVQRETLLLGGLAYALNERVPAPLRQELHELLVLNALKSDGEPQLSILHLLKDPTQARDSLGSFLGESRCEALLRLVGVECADDGSRQSLHAAVEKALDQIAEADGVSSGWLTLHTVLSDLPPYDDLVDKLRRVLHHTDLAHLFQQDANLAWVAVQVATTQAIHLDDEDYYQRLRRQVVEITRLLAERSTDGMPEVPRDTLGFLLHAAVSVARGVPAAESAVVAFADLLNELVHSWPALKREFHPIVQRLYEELPISSGHNFYELLLQLRADP